MQSADLRQRPGTKSPFRFSLPGEWIDRHGRSTPKTAINSIVVVKADHIGDLLIAGPAFGLLRRFFPAARIDLVCGPWNVGLARKLGVFDGVYGVSLFHEIGAKQSDIEIARTARREGVKTLQDLRLGAYDLAIDLRHDRDSRSVLSALDARIYAGFGTSREYPFLDILLPIDEGGGESSYGQDLVLSGREFSHGGQIAAARNLISLELRVSGAISPADCGTVAEDKRDLGIGLTGIVLTPILHGNQPADGWEPMTLRPPSRDLALVAGWAEPEAWGTWGLGSLLRLDITLPPSRGESEIRLDLDLLAHVHRANPEVVCDIRCDGSTLGEPVRFLTPQNKQTAEVTIPRRHSNVVLTSDPFGLSPGQYEGMLRVYLPMPVDPEMAMRLTLRDGETNAALNERQIGWGTLRSGLCDIPYGCVVENGEQMLRLEVETDDAGAFEGARIEMFTLHRIDGVKLKTPAAHMEKRASLLVLRVAMEFSREPPFDDNFITGRLTAGDDATPGLDRADELRASLHRWQAAGACVVGVALGCSNPIRTWPRHYFVELCRLLLDLGAVKLAFVGGPADRSDAEAACHELRLDPTIHSLCGEVGLAELGRLLQPLDLFIGNNTGTTHYAGRVGVRTIGIYSGTNHPREWGPVGENVSWIYRDEDCAPCFLSDIRDCHYGHVCLKNLLPADVLAVVAPEVIATLSRRSH